MRWKREWSRVLVATSALAMWAGAVCWAQQPKEPVDPSPQDGQPYALMNQASGLQLALNGSDTRVVTRDLTSMAQRWALVRLLDGSWKLASQISGECLAAAAYAGVKTETCSASPRQDWRIVAQANGYATLKNKASGGLLTANAGTVSVDEAEGSQAQLWQLRPAFWRGADVAEQEKMEALRVKTGLPWWKDADKPEDILQVLKDHGFNSIRLRPTSIPPYYPNQPANTCTGNYCYIETDAQELDLARRARNLGFSLELTLFFDGGGSQSTPGSWAG